MTWVGSCTSAVGATQTSSWRSARADASCAARTESSRLLRIDLDDQAEVCPAPQLFPYQYKSVSFVASRASDGIDSKTCYGGAKSWATIRKFLPPRP